MPCCRHDGGIHADPSGAYVCTVDVQASLGPDVHSRRSGQFFEEDPDILTSMQSLVTSAATDAQTSVGSQGIIFRAAVNIYMARHSIHQGKISASCSLLAAFNVLMIFIFT